VLEWLHAHPFVLAYLTLAALSALVAERSRIDLWCEAHPLAAAILKIIRALGFDFWGAVAAYTLIVKQRLPLAQRPPPTLVLPPDPPLPSEFDEL
jgi:hypothetical protein